MRAASLSLDAVEPTWPAARITQESRAIRGERIRLKYYHMVSTCTCTCNEMRQFHLAVCICVQKSNFNGRERFFNHEGEYTPTYMYSLLLLFLAISLRMKYIPTL